MAEGVRSCLEDAGFATEICLRAVEGEEIVLRGEHQIVLMDVLLPDGDGVEICRRLRKSGVTTPIILLTALSETEQKIDGLDVGADDYICKPFKPEELAARVRAVVRRTTENAAPLLHCDDLVLNTHSRTIQRGAATHRLETRQFDLLRYLMRNQNRVISRQTLCESVWKFEVEPSSNVIDVYVASLRKLVHVPGLRPLIHTVRGSGYRLGILD